ncbi:MAG: aminoacyl-tRNA hydrolase [Sphingobacteriales bacterium]|nr:MAG: aminoacyl-tRNA hydrolase [Sphingobacteriales bacterium]
MNKFLIVGLGNIGAEYVNTRHNIGFNVLEVLAQKHTSHFRSDRLADITECSIKGRKLICIKPTTYMNLSGKAVKYWADKEHIALENILVILDEIALPIDKLRLRPSGSAGGHNGLKSIEEVMGTDAYARLRFGVGNNYPKGEQVEYVLGKWAAEEWPLVEKKITVSVNLIETFVLAGLATAMNQFNKLSITL